MNNSIFALVRKEYALGENKNLTITRRINGEVLCILETINREGEKNNKLFLSWNDLQLIIQSINTWDSAIIENEPREKEISEYLNRRIIAKLQFSEEVPSIDIGVYYVNETLYPTKFKFILENVKEISLLLSIKKQLEKNVKEFTEFGSIMSVAFYSVKDKFLAFLQDKDSYPRPITNKKEVRDFMISLPRDKYYLATLEEDIEKKQFYIREIKPKDLLWYIRVYAFDSLLDFITED